MHISVCIFALLFSWHIALNAKQVAGANMATPSYEQMLESAKSGTFVVSDHQPAPKTQLEEVLNGSENICYADIWLF